MCWHLVSILAAVEELLDEVWNNEWAEHCIVEWAGLELQLHCAMPLAV